MLIDSVDLIRKLPMMIQGNKTFAKFSEGGDYHIGEVDSWCLNYKEIVEGIESYCEYKRTNQYKLGAPVNGSFALNSYDYDEPQTEVETMSCAECKHRPIGAEICEEACHYEPQTDWHYDEQDATWYPYKHEDEPQQKSCATCKHALGNWDGESNNCGRCCGADRRFYEPKVEPQTDGYMTAEQAEDYRKMLDKAEHKVYGNIEDEPQTDCSWK